MSDSPHYRFYRKPRFSANHVAEYLCTNTAPQRTGVIRRAKFPRKPEVTAYQQVKPAICQFLATNSGDLSFFDIHIQKLEAKARRETGYPRIEANRCLDALEAFKKAFRRSRAAKYHFVAGPTDLAMPTCGVSINVHLDALLIEELEDRTPANIGGCVLFVAGSDDARENIEKRRKHVAGLVHWALERAPQDIEPLPRLCMSFDVFGGEVVKAPTSYDRFRRAVEDSCREVAGRWDDVGPPAGYDGPDWR